LTVGNLKRFFAPCEKPENIDEPPVEAMEEVDGGGAGIGDSRRS